MDAFSYIAGFSIFNDWSCRDLQRDEMEARLGPYRRGDTQWIPSTLSRTRDVVEIEVEGIGILRNTIAPKVNSASNYRFKAPPPGTPARSR